MSNSTTNSVADHCEAARILAASKLEAIVNACAAEASGEKKSVQHAKFVLEIAQLAPASAAEKKSKPSPDQAETKVDEQQETEPREKSFAELLIDTLNELRSDPVK